MSMSENAAGYSEDPTQSSHERNDSEDSCSAAFSQLNAAVQRCPDGKILNKRSRNSHRVSDMHPQAKRNCSDKCQPNHPVPNGQARSKPVQNISAENDRSHHGHEDSPHPHRGHQLERLKTEPIWALSGKVSPNENGLGARLLENGARSRGKGKSGQNVICARAEAGENEVDRIN